MTNEEKYKTHEEREDAFNAFCDQHKSCDDCRVLTTMRRTGVCTFAWLALDAEEEKPDSCPYCDDATSVVQSQLGHSYFVRCRCGYQSMHVATKDGAVTRHNRLCRKLSGKVKRESQDG